MTDDDAAEKDYIVGPGRPPLHSRFKPGQKSANPKGRPKGSLGLAATMRREGNKKVTVTEQGRKRTVTKIEAAVVQLVRRAMQGDFQSTKLLLEQVAKTEVVQAGANHELVVPELDPGAIRRVAERILRNAKEETDDEPSPDV